MFALFDSRRQGKQTVLQPCVFIPQRLLRLCVTLGCEICELPYQQRAHYMEAPGGLHNQAYSPGDWDFGLTML